MRGLVTFFTQEKRTGMGELAGSVLFFPQSPVENDPPLHGEGVLVHKKKIGLSGIGTQIHGSYWSFLYRQALPYQDHNRFPIDYTYGTVPDTL